MQSCGLPYPAIELKHQVELVPLTLHHSYFEKALVAQFRLLKFVARALIVYA